MWRLQKRAHSPRLLAKAMELALLQLVLLRDAAMHRPMLHLRPQIPLLQPGAPVFRPRPGALQAAAPHHVLRGTFSALQQDLRLLHELKGFGCGLVTSTTTDHLLMQAFQTAGAPPSITQEGLQVAHVGKGIIPGGAMMIAVLFSREFAERLSLVHHNVCLNTTPRT